MTSSSSLVDLHYLSSVIPGAGRFGADDPCDET
jgi:hypothetical protein